MGLHGVLNDVLNGDRVTLEKGTYKSVSFFTILWIVAEINLKIVFLQLKQLLKCWHVCVQLFKAFRSNCATFYHLGKKSKTDFKIIFKNPIVFEMFFILFPLAKI